MRSLEQVANKYNIAYMTLLMRLRRSKIEPFRYKKKIFINEQQEQEICFPIYKRRKNIIVLFQEKKYIILESKMNYE
jgi:hypothetical protein